MAETEYRIKSREEYLYCLSFSISNKFGLSSVIYFLFLKMRTLITRKAKRKGTNKNNVKFKLLAK